MSLEIRRLGHHGDGIADGPVYVARALPGEIVDGVVEDGRIAKPRILKPSAERVRAPCPHYNGCGGCALMHARDSFVSDWKISVVRAALEAHGLPTPIRGVATSPPESRRRAAFSGRRLRKSVVVGFHQPKSETVTAIPDCQVLRPSLRGFLPFAEQLTSRFGPRRGELRVLVTDSFAGLDVSFEHAAPLTMEDSAFLADLAESADLARLSRSDEVLIERRPPAQYFDGVSIVPPPASFLQATQHGEDMLRAAVAEGVGNAQRIADLFAGCGTFGLPLSRKAAVHAVEAAHAPLRAAEAAWRGAPGLKPFSVEARDLYRQPLRADELNAFDAVVIDPPRAGADAQVREIAASTVARVAAVSCNPVTFARDAASLVAGGFRLELVQIVDQFRWSAHIELASTFVRDHIASD